MHFCSQSITEGVLGKNSGRNLNSDTKENAACWLTHSLAHAQLSFLIYPRLAFPERVLLRVCWALLYQLPIKIISKTYKPT